MKLALAPVPLVFFFLLLVGVPLRSAEVKFIVDVEIGENQKKWETLDRRLKMLQTQLKGMVQTVFRTEEDRYNYEKRKAEIQGQISHLEPEVRDLAEALAFLKKKRAIFTNSLNGGKVDYFFSPPIDAKTYEAEMAKVGPVLQQILPSVSLWSRPQVLIYKSKEDYQTFESAPKNLLGHSVAQRVCEAGSLVQVLGLGNRKVEYITICQEGGTEAFHHQMAHLFLDKLMNPSHSSTIHQRTSPFLDEGFAENIASVFNESRYDEKVHSLSKTVTGASTNTLASQIQAEAPSGGFAPAAQNEAILFVRWVSRLPNGFQLLRQLFNSRNSEHEAVVRNFQSSLGLPRNGFEGYYMWRSNEFERVQQKLSSSAAPH